jgi:hypothetical protein
MQHNLWKVGFFAGLLLMFLTSLVGCSNKKSIIQQFKYELQQQTYQADLISPLHLQVQGNSLEFAIIFKDGGGSLDEARLERSGTLLRIILFDTDGKLQDMWVVYIFSGSVLELTPGNYTIQIEDSEGNLIAKEMFVIQ